MTEPKAPLDIEHEKKKNIKLAIGLAAFGILAYFFLYIFMFAIMFFKPGIMFSMMPFSGLAEQKALAGIDNRLFVISTEYDFAGLSFANQGPPEKKYIIHLFDGNQTAPLYEIEPYNSIASSRDKIYFLNDGLYRIFDGKNWTEIKTDAIGKNPRAAAGGTGIWVLSKIRKKPLLNLIKENEVVSAPLPEEFLSKNKYGYSCSTQLLWFQKNLYLVWFADGSMYWSVYDGNLWSTTEYPDYSGSVKILADDARIYLLNEYFNDQQRGLTLTIYEDGVWSEPEALGIGELFIDWSPVIYRKSLLILARGVFSQKLYTVENGEIVKSMSIGDPLFGRGFILRIIQLTAIGTIAFFVCIYLISAFINRFKLRTWQLNSDEYEFAGIFRRFTAKFIDSLIIILPPYALVIYLMANSGSFSNPLYVFTIMFMSAGYLILGGFLYHSLLEGIYGKTLGKKLCGIAVLKDDFTKCGLLAGFLRNLLRIVDYFLGYLVGAVTIAGTLKWQRLGDVVAGTVVVRKRRIKNDN